MSPAHFVDFGRLSLWKRVGTVLVALVFWPRKRVFWLWRWESPVWMVVSFDTATGRDVIMWVCEEPLEAAKQFESVCDSVREEAGK